MAQLPSGTVTFVFSDIEGSTALLKQLGEGYDAVLSNHRRLMRETFTERGGVEIDTQGDAFFFAFPRARDAVEAAVDVQRAHAAHDWPEGCAVHVRMGLHTGEPAVGSEGYLGLDVVRAARLCTAGKGGHVLLSDTTRALVGATLPEGVSIFPLGERRLKDIDEPERVFELEIEGAAPPVPADDEDADVRPADATAATAPAPPRRRLRRPAGGADHGKGAEPLERSLERATSQVDALADRAAKRPETIAERLEEDEPSRALRARRGGASAGAPAPARSRARNRAASSPEPVPSGPGRARSAPRTRRARRRPRRRHAAGR